jgi:hypothetical protein
MRQAVGTGFYFRHALGQVRCLNKSLAYRIRTLPGTTDALELGLFTTALFCFNPQPEILCELANRAGGRLWAE